MIELLRRDRIRRTGRSADAVARCPCARIALAVRSPGENQRVPGAVGGSDYHCPAGKETNYLRLGQPTTWVKIGARTVEAILDGLQAGRSCISATPDGPRIDLTATVDGQRVPMGGRAQARSDQAIELAVEVWGGGGRELRVIADGSVAETVDLPQERTSAPFSVEAARFIRAEIVGDMRPGNIPGDAPVGLDLRNWRWALSNPIYVAMG